MKQILHLQVAQLHQIIDAVPSMIAFLDAQECHCYANTAYLQNFHYSSHGILGTSLRQVIGITAYQQLQVAIQYCLTGDVVQLCIPLAIESRQLCYRQAVLIPLKQSQRIAGFYLLIHEIAAHETVTALIQSQADYFQYALEGAAVGVWDWDLLTGEMTWSHQQERLFGLRPGAFDGAPETFLALIEKGDRSVVEQALQSSIEFQEPFSREFRVRLNDGSVRWLSHRGQVFLEQTGSATPGRPVHLSGVAFDITAQKLAADKLRQQVNREHLIAEISQEINRSTQISELLPQILPQIREALEVDRVVITRLQDSRVGEVTYEAYGPAVDPLIGWELRQPWIIRTQIWEKCCQGCVVAIDDIYQENLAQAELDYLKHFQIAADLTMPLIEDGALWGLLSAHRKQCKTWQPEEHRLLETFGTQVSVAFQRDRLYRELTAANEKLRSYAYLDGLTQVANRRRFEQFISDEWRRLVRERAPLAVIMADIDCFKAYNDTYGHQAGDECLRRIAGILSSAIQRPADLVARYGGEEFVIVLPRTDAEGATTVAERIRTLVRHQRIPHKAAALDNIVTLSFGVAAQVPSLLKSPEELIEAADNALYSSKEGGRDLVSTA